MKRYKININDSQAIPDSNGSWVKYDTVKDELERLKKIESLYFGIKTEFKISDLFPGSSVTGITHSNGDIITVKGSRIEVKFSSNHAHGESLARWEWLKIFGSSNKKEYDYLLLVGNINKRTNKFFLFKFEELPRLMIKHDKSRNIFRISARYSEKSFSKYSRYFSPFEIQLNDFIFHKI